LGLAESLVTKLDEIMPERVVFIEHAKAIVIGINRHNLLI